MHPFHVSLKLLRLAEFLSAEVAVGTIAAGIRRATVSSMHLKVVQSQEELKNNLTRPSLGKALLLLVRFVAMTEIW